MRKLLYIILIAVIGATVFFGLTETTKAKLDPPVKISPCNNEETSLTPTLKWSSIPGITGYYWVVKSFINDLVIDSGTIYRFGPNIPTETTIPAGKLKYEVSSYKWNVAIIDAVAGKNDFSSPWCAFAIKTSPQTIPTPSSVPSPSAGTIPNITNTGSSRDCEGQPLSIKNPNTYCTERVDGKCPPENVVAYSGLVPCGKCVIKAPPLEDGKLVLTDGVLEGSTGEYVSCQFCHFFVMFDGIIDFVLFDIVVPLGILLLVIGGAFFVFSAGDPSKVNKGKSIMTSVAIGLAIIFAAWLIVNVIFLALGLSDFGMGLTGPGKWFSIPCSL